MQYKKVLITGADGFIGSHLTELLLEKGFHVKALSQYNSFNDWGWLEDIPANERLQVVSGDVRDPFFCEEISKDVDIIFHLAALIAIPYSYIAPQSYVETNVNGTLNICNAARKNRVSKVLVTSTSEIYGTALYVPIDEKHPKQPQSPYSASKIGADAMALSFYHAFNLPVTVVRPFNTFGPRQSARAIIPTIISQIASGKKQIMLGDLTPTRDFNFVQDIARGFWLISEADNTDGKEINISSNSEVSMAETFNLIREIMHSDVEFVTEEKRLRPENSEVFRLWGDNSQIKKLTGYEPKFSLREGLELTCRWFTDPVNLKKYKTNIYNL